MFFCPGLTIWRWGGVGRTKTFLLYLSCFWGPLNTFQPISDYSNKRLTSFPKHFNWLRASAVCYKQSFSVIDYSSLQISKVRNQFPLSTSWAYKAVMKAAQFKGNEENQVQCPAWQWSTKCRELQAMKKKNQTAVKYFNSSLLHKSLSLALLARVNTNSKLDTTPFFQRTHD